MDFLNGHHCNIQSSSMTLSHAEFRVIWPGWTSSKRTYVEAHQKNTTKAQFHLEHLSYWFQGQQSIKVSLSGLCWHLYLLPMPCEINYAHLSALCILSDRLCIIRQSTFSNKPVTRWGSDGVDVMQPSYRNSTWGMQKLGLPQHCTRCQQEDWVFHLYFWSFIRY